MSEVFVAAVVALQVLLFWGERRRLVATLARRETERGVGYRDRATVPCEHPPLRARGLFVTVWCTRCGERLPHDPPRDRPWVAPPKPEGPKPAGEIPFPARKPPQPPPGVIEKRTRPPKPPTEPLTKDER